MQQTLNKAPRSILLIDDDELDRRFTRDAIGKVLPTVRIFERTNGQEGIVAIAEEAPALILLDLHMPLVDGFEFLKMVKNEADVRRIPIIVVSTSDSQQDVCKALDLHANAYIKKPTKLEDYSLLADRVCKFWLDLAVSARMSN